MARHPHVIRSAADVPPPLVDAFIRDMARRMSGTPEARACVGLSFTFISSDVAVRPARYEVGRDGVIAVRRGDRLPATFTFVSDANTFDSVLRGRESALLALLRRHIRLDGSFHRIRCLLRMMPAVQDAYAATRDGMCVRYRTTYDFAF
ncbi:MAG TPA: hypothetical protein VF155_01985 [Candidatus Dormibacteraeota bacterium]